MNNNQGPGLGDLHRWKDKYTEFEKWECDYKKSNNPFCVWRVISMCSEEKMPLPEWVTNYLREVSLKFTGMALGIVEENEDKRSQELVYEALGMNKKRGPINYYEAYKKRINEIEIFLEIRKMVIYTNGKGIQKATKEVAKEKGVCYETAREIWYRLKKE